MTARISAAIALVGYEVVIYGIGCMVSTILGDVVKA